MKTEQAGYTEVEVQELIAKAIKQDREFQAQVLRALPLLSADARQNWIETPKAVKRTLQGFEAPPTEDGQVEFVQCNAVWEGKTLFEIEMCIKSGQGLAQRIATFPDLLRLRSGFQELPKTARLAFAAGIDEEGGRTKYLHITQLSNGAKFQIVDEWKNMTSRDFVAVIC